MTSVVILRHEAIGTAMGHDLWAKYKFGELFKVTDPATKAAAVRNPFFQMKESEQPLPNITIEDLQAGQLGAVLSPIILPYFRDPAVPLCIAGGLYLLGALCWLFIDACTPLEEFAVHP